MKGPFVTLPVRRLAAALVLGAALVTSGCGTTQANRAAVVDGSVISETEVQTAQAQINEAFPTANLSMQDTLSRLIRAPYEIDYVAAHGNPQSESVARSQYPGQDPDPATIELLRGELSRQFLDETGKQEVTKTLQALHVTVNPRYGVFDAGSAEIVPTLPGWVQQASSQ